MSRLDESLERIVLRDGTNLEYNGCYQYGITAAPRGISVQRRIASARASALQIEAELRTLRSSLAAVRAHTSQALLRSRR